MVCSQCHAAVPDESAFCLRCGARLPRPARPAPVNGRGTTPVQPAVAAAPGVRRVGAATAPPATPAGKQPYALSFKPLADERLRYRVARWVCDVAPAHPLSEVQADLSRGAFATFLAMTADEAELARQRIEKLGAHPALWQLAPASTAELLLPAREAPARPEGAWDPRKKFAAVGIGLALAFVFGVFALQMWGPTAGKPNELPTAPPSIPAARP